MTAAPVMLEDPRRQALEVCWFRADAHARRYQRAGVADDALWAAYWTGAGGRICGFEPIYPVAAADLNASRRLLCAYKCGREAGERFRRQLAHYTARPS